MSSTTFIQHPTPTFDTLAFKSCTLPIRPEALALASMNKRAIETGLVVNAEPQHPSVIGLSCSAIPLEEVQKVLEGGRLFQFTERGIMGGAAALGTLGYAFRHLFPRAALLEGVAHTCDDPKRECRGATIPSSSGGLPVLTPPRVELTEPIAGCIRTSLQPSISIPLNDVQHVRAQMRSIIAKSKDIGAAIRDGSLIVMEGYWDRKSGKVLWVGMWESENPELQLKSDEVRGHLLSGDFTRDQLQDFRPGLKELHALVVGNRSFAENYEFQPYTAPRIIVYTCADSRIPRQLFDAPFGTIEWMRLAGSPEDAFMFSSIRIALESARDDSLDPNHPVTLLMLSHGDCGAINATISKTPLPEGDPAAPLRELLAPRFHSYHRKHAEPKESDPHLIEAAKANSIGLGQEILTSSNPNAIKLRDHAAHGRLLMLPAVCLLHEGGRVVFLDPVLPQASWKNPLPQLPDVL